MKFCIIDCEYLKEALEETKSVGEIKWKELIVSFFSFIRYIRIYCVRTTRHLLDSIICLQREGVTSQAIGRGFEGITYLSHEEGFSVVAHPWRRTRNIRCGSKKTLIFSFSIWSHKYVVRVLLIIGNLFDTVIQLITNVIHVYASPEWIDWSDRVVFNDRNPRWIFNQRTFFESFLLRFN